jgi:hypothetical protein
LPQPAKKNNLAGYDVTQAARSRPALPIPLKLLNLRRSCAAWVSRLDVIKRLRAFP